MEKAKDFWRLQNKTNKSKMRKNNAISFLPRGKPREEARGVHTQRKLFLQTIHYLQEGSPRNIEKDARPCSQHHQTWGVEGVGIEIAQKECAYERVKWPTP